MSRIAIFFLFLIFLEGVCLAKANGGEKVYEVVRDSNENLYELTLVNHSWIPEKSILIYPKNIPEWIVFSPDSFWVKRLSTGEKVVVPFTFSVTKDAPLNTRQTICMEIKTASGIRISRKFVLTVKIPFRFGLYQNYPNPFNSFTTIRYQLSEPSFVNLKVFNILGEEVIELVKEKKNAGLYEVHWDATGLASGVYFYQIRVTGKQFGKRLLQKRMILLK